MGKSVSKEKSKSLRPLRIALAVLVVILFIMILDRLPTSRRTKTTSSSGTGDTSEISNQDFYYFTGFLEQMEEDLEKRLSDLGVPEEEYGNAGEYLSKDEIFELETRVTLVSNFQSNYVYATESDLARLREIFNLGEAYSFEEFRVTDVTPTEYKNLADLIAEYDKTLNTVEDYDLPVEEK